MLPPALALLRVGCLVLGRADSPVLTGAAATAAQEGVAVELLTAAEVTRRLDADAGRLARLPVRVERRVMHFCAPRAAPETTAPDAMPTSIWDLAAGDSLYGSPREGADGVKVVEGGTSFDLGFLDPGRF